MDPKVRDAIIAAAISQLGKPYEFGYQIQNLDDADPPKFDCSEFTRWCYHKAGVRLLDGSGNQYEQTIPADEPKPGDLGFFKETRAENDAGRKIGVVYHVGILADNIRVIEARGAPYGKVIYRPVSAWRSFPNFSGWRRHPDL